MVSADVHPVILVGWGVSYFRRCNLQKSVGARNNRHTAFCSESEAVCGQTFQVDLFPDTMRAGSFWLLLITVNKWAFLHRITTNSGSKGHQKGDIISLCFSATFYPHKVTVHGYYLNNYIIMHIMLYIMIVQKGDNLTGVGVGGHWLVQWQSVRFYILCMVFSVEL